MSRSGWRRAPHRGHRAQGRRHCGWRPLLTRCSEESEGILMSTDRTGPRRRHPSRRDFLATGAKAGASLALASAGLEVVWRSANAGSVTLTYIGLKSNANVHVQQEMLNQFAKMHPGVRTQFATAPTGSADAYHDKLVTIFS